MTDVAPATRLPAGGVDLVYASEAGTIEGRLHTEPDAKGVIVLAYPTAYSRFGQHDEALCAIAHAHGYSTLSVDLLTPEETTVRTGELRAHLRQRLSAVFEDCHRRGQARVLVFAIGEAAPEAVPAAHGRHVHAIVTCALPGTVTLEETDSDCEASSVLECTPTLDEPLTWDEIDRAVRRAMVWFDAGLPQRDSANP
ncbi:MAG: hypothetical protein EPO52_17360 [Herbiconiux sp.]|uniref:hypothetical protein n=1 Tax=Herbiconiux sp. TaxID=1871186 RepID=UPI0011F5E363|nr:hypothetical protein [Herbiconiux sp.]TAJ46304.1 MAG: hypothetical protein EPO52_17360 [Herbiconiux sp.]